MRDWKKRSAHWLRNFLCGVLIGAGGILPGVSGGVLAVVFGVYRPFMELLTHPKTALPRYWRWIPPLALGSALGFMGLARGIAAAIAYSGAMTTWLFIGLIAGTLPALFRDAGKEGRPPAAWASLLLCAAAVFAGLFYVSRIARSEVTPNFWWYGFCGVLWGMGVVIPGMTSASVMMALGLYHPMMEGLAALDMTVLLPALPGLLAAMLGLARLVTWLFRRHYALACHGILGIVLASVLVIIPTAYRGPGELAGSVLCCAAGFALAFLLSRLDRRVRAEEAGT